MTANFSLSTSWARGRFTSLRDFFKAAQTIGVERFELDAFLSLKAIANISLPEGQIPSLEVPCPAHPRNFEAKFASLDRYERDAAREAALNSIQLAFDVKAQVLIINLGRIERSRVSPKLEEALHQAWQSGGKQSNTFQDLRKELIDARARQVSPHLKAALHDVEYLANQADKFGLKLALVTPPTYLGLPLPEEMHLILEEFGDPVYYWHDIGQAQIFDTLTRLPQNIWLEIFSEKTIGYHLYDTITLNKWLPPQQKGEVAFDTLVNRISKETLLTCKFSSAHEPEAVAEGLTMLQAVLGFT